METILKLSSFPKQVKGLIQGYKNETFQMPNKIIEVGLLPNTPFIILHQAPFGGPLYLEFGEEQHRVVIRREDAQYILVEAL